MEPILSEPINSIISPWMPTTNPHEIAVLGKNIEELGEAISRLARCLIQGSHEMDPESGLRNQEELAKEFADVRATMSVTENYLMMPLLKDREKGKINGFMRWHNLIQQELDKKNGII